MYGFFLGGGGCSPFSIQSRTLDGAHKHALHSCITCIHNHYRYLHCLFHARLGPRWDKHHPVCGQGQIFSQLCSLRSFTGTHPVLRGIAHRPSVVSSTFRCLVNRTLRCGMASLYRDFTHTSRGWGCTFTGYGVLPKSCHLTFSDEHRFLT